MRLKGRESDPNTLTSSFCMTSAYLRHADNWVPVDVTRLFAPQFTRCRQKPSFFKRRIMCIVSERGLRSLFDRLMDTAPACQRMPDVFLTQRLSLTRPHEAGLSGCYIVTGIRSSIRPMFCMILIEFPPVLMSHSGFDCLFVNCLLGSCQIHDWLSLEFILDSLYDSNCMLSIDIYSCEYTTCQLTRWLDVICLSIDR